MYPGCKTMVYRLQTFLTEDTNTQFLSHSPRSHVPPKNSELWRDDSTHSLKFTDSLCIFKQLCQERHFSLLLLHPPQMNFAITPGSEMSFHCSLVLPQKDRGFRTECNRTEINWLQEV